MLRYRRDLRRFAAAVTAFSLLFAALGRFFGEDLALQLQRTPTTSTGWLLLGWLVGGPPILVTALVWHERRHLRRNRRVRLSYLLAGWVALGAFLAPARVGWVGLDHQFGTGALVGDPLSAGWAWGALANVVGIVFSAAVLWTLNSTVPGGPSDDQRDMTARFLERTWMVLLVVSLGFALYGSGAGLIQTGA